MKVLIDWMTHRGNFIPCTRNGVNRIPNISCIRKASFEETVEMMYDASVFSEVDPVNYKNLIDFIYIYFIKNISIIFLLNKIILKNKL